jgi:glycosyltransferase involved in cell wall biosynthesis
MRIIHLVPSVGPYSGGMGASTIEMVRAQQEAGVLPSIWCADDAQVAAAAARGLDVASLLVAGPRRFALSFSGERRSRMAGVDVVHQHGLWTAQSRITEAFRSRNIPAVVAPHGSLAPYARRRSWWKKRIALALFERRNLQLASCLHATSQQELRDIREFGLRAPVALIPNAVSRSWIESQAEPERFRRLHGSDGHTRVMLFLARVHPIKGLPLLLEALALERHRLRDWRLVIAGPDADGHREKLARQAERLGVSEMIDFVGLVADEKEKRGLFANADLFVLPTHTENFGIVIAEALACGVPVVTTHGAPWRELEEHGCGWWVPVHPRAIADALVDAAARPAAELRAMGERGRALVGACYVWSIVAERSLALYSWLRGGAARPDFVVVD